MKGLLYITGILLLGLSACGPSTRITGSWKSPEADSRYSQIIVAALAQNNTAKITAENIIVDELTKAGIKATAAHVLFAPNFTRENAPDKDAILRRVRAEGGDAILTVGLIDKETETRYVPGSTMYAPVGYYRSFGGYYNYMYPMTYSPGYYTTDKTYFLETNLYDAGSEHLVFSAQSETYNPSSLQNATKGYTKVLIEKLKAEKLIP